MVVAEVPVELIHLVARQQVLTVAPELMVEELVLKELVLLLLIFQMLLMAE
jgi:hypothetical protein